MSGFTVPVVPNFTGVTVPTIAQLNQLSAAVNFLADADAAPSFHLYKTAQQTLTGAQWNTLNFGSAAFDPNSGSNSTGYTIQTQGYYAFEACTQLVDVSSGSTNWSTAFLLTGGGNNPNLANGSTWRFGWRGSTTGASSSVDDAQSTCDLSPCCLYVNDIVSVQVWVAALGGGTLDNNRNQNFMQGRFVVNFTGLWVRRGP